MKIKNEYSQGSFVKETLSLSAMQDKSILLAICSNRPENLIKFQSDLIEVLAPGDLVYAIIDLPKDNVSADLSRKLDKAQYKVFFNKMNKGLSYSRNRLISMCPHPYILFIDDDVTVPKQTLNGLRIKLFQGKTAVGSRLILPNNYSKLPWYIPKGIYHYLGLHCQASIGRIWGGCMAFNMEFIRDKKIYFQHGLGRQGKALQSGDDTFFVSEIKKNGGSCCFLSESVAFHYITQRRYSLKYLSRRAFWQGRSEVRRDNIFVGLKKETKRLFFQTTPISHIFIALLMFIFLAIGCLWEILQGKSAVK